MINLPLMHEALVSIAASRLRTILAMLGIVIGVGSVVLMMGVGAGSKATIEQAISKLGSNLLIVTPGSRNINGLRSNTAFSPLTAADADALRQLPAVMDTASSTSPRAFQVAMGKLNWSTQISGVTPSFFAIRNWTFESGESFSEQDVKRSERVAVIGQSIVTQLFPDSDPMHAVIRIGQLPFRIVGVLEAKGQGLDGRDQDDAIYIPITTAQRKLLGDFWRESVAIIFVQAASKEDIDDAQDQIQTLLRERKRIRANENDSFTVRNLTSITQTATETTRALTMLLGAIASISLIVGGIGIMNIMLVTVTERTREIGIRKAIGATNTDIMHQFLMEAMMITGIGSLLGLLFGILSIYATQAWGGVPTRIGLWPILLSLAVAVVVGILSGLYPAQRAADLKPIEALRSIGA